MTITIAVVTRNRSKLLSQLLSSLEKSTLRPDEILIIDNLSTDDTGNTVHSYIPRLPIRYEICKNIGVNAARNHAINSCRSELLAFIDDDAEPQSTWLQESLAMFETHGDAAAVIGVKGNFFADKLIPSVIQFMSRDISMARDRCGDVALSPSLFDTCNCFLRVSIFRNTGIRFDESFHKGGDRYLGHQLFALNLPVYFAEKSIVLHKWPHDIKSYCLMRWNAGKAKASLVKKLGLKHFNIHTQRNKSISIRSLLTQKKRSFSFRGKILFTLFVFLGLLITKTGYLYGRCKN